MGEFLSLVIGFPTLLFTVPLGLSLVYWAFVIVGALDIDLFDSISGGGEALEGVDGLAEGAAEGAAEGLAEGLAEGAAEGLAEGAAEGLAEGAAEGLAEGAAEGVAEGAAEGVIESAADGAVEAASEGALAFIANILRIGKVPITISLSLLFLIGWLMSGIGAVVLGSLLPLGGALGWLLQAGLGLGSLICSTALTSFLLRPLEGAFKMKTAMGASELCGKVATLTTNTIDATFGQANIYHDEADLNIHVRYAEPNELKKGAKLLLISYSPKSNAYEIEPYAALLDELDDTLAIDRAKARARAASAQDIKE